MLTGFLEAQDLDYVRSVVDTLASPGMAGRGYADHGDCRAATYLAEQYHAIGLKAFGRDYFQPYHFPMNIFDGNVELTVDGKKLSPGRDFLVASNTRDIHGTYELVWMADTSLSLEQVKAKASTMELKDKFLVLERCPELMRNLELEGVKGVLLLREGHLVWSVSNAHETREMTAIEIQRDQLPAGTTSVTLDIDSRFVRKYRTQNVIGCLEGSVVPDSFLVITAHYDHLGKLGPETYFPGANDNASGTAMMLDLARYYASGVVPLKYSMVFMAFSGEEAGLLGSGYNADHPLFPLDHIRFLVNIDMAGTGSDGIAMVNGTVFEKEISLLNAINEEHHFMKEVKKRGESAHSDHHPFYKKGVKAVFIYTFGDQYKEYHNIYDRSEALPYTGYRSYFQLLTRFLGSL